MFNHSMCNMTVAEPRITEATKAKICTLLESCNGDVNCAWHKADDFRLGNLPNSWSDLENREVENWLFIINNPNAWNSQPWAVNTYEGFVKHFRNILISTTPFSIEAWSSALDALNHKGEMPVDLSKWCNSCGK